jgi:hypothetical protein
MNISEISVGDQLKIKQTVGPIPYGLIVLLNKMRMDFVFNCLDTKFILSELADENGSLK